MPQSQLSVFIGQMTLTSSQTDTSTYTPAAFDVVDAVNISAFVTTGTTTAPGLQLQGAFTTESTAVFVALSYGSSGAPIAYLTTASITTVYAPAIKQVRIGTSGVTSTGYTVILSKNVLV